MLFSNGDGDFGEGAVGKLRGIQKLKGGLDLNIKRLKTNFSSSL